MNRDYLSNLIFGVTFLNLAIVGSCTLVLGYTFFIMVRLGAIMCNLIMGLALILNSSSKSKSSPLYKPYWLGMIMCNIIIVKMIDTSYPIVSISSFIFILGLVIVMLSLFSLKGSFTVTPMLSEIKTHYAYTFVRHPMYLGESIMVLSCVIAGKTPISILVFIVYLSIAIFRIQEEERLLLQMNQYKIYRLNTRWRLLPYIW